MQQGQENIQGQNNTNPSANGQAPGGQPDEGGSKTSATNAQAANSSQQPSEGGDQGSGNTDMSPEEMKQEIKKLRAENAKHRTQKKDLESKFNTMNERFSKMESGLKNLFGEGEGNDDLPPEKKLEQFQQKAETLEVQNAILSTAYEMGIDKSRIKYFQFLVNEKLQDLGDNEEITDEDWEEIRKECLKGAGPTNSSVSSGQAANQQPGSPAPDAGQDDISVEEFSQMSIAQKSELYQKDKQKYDALMNEARKTNTFVSSARDRGPSSLRSMRVKS